MLFCFQAERDEVGTALLSHVCVVVVVVQDPPSLGGPLARPWGQQTMEGGGVKPARGGVSAIQGCGLALHCHVTVSHDHVMDSRGHSAFMLTKPTFQAVLLSTNRAACLSHVTLLLFRLCCRYSPHTFWVIMEQFSFVFRPRGPLSRVVTHALMTCTDQYLRNLSTPR